MSDFGVAPATPDIVRELEAVLGRRLDELEKENRKLRRQGALVIGLGAVMLLATALLLVSVVSSAGRVHEVLEAQRFVVRDTEGFARAVIGMSPDNSSRIVLQDRDGRERLKLSLLADGSAGVSFADREGQSRAVLGILPDETSTLVFADRAGRTRAVLGLSPDNASTLVFADRLGETRVGVGVEADGSAGLTLFERDLGGQTAPASDTTVDTIEVPAGL